MSDATLTDNIEVWWLRLSNVFFLAAGIYALIPRINQRLSPRLIHSFLCLVIAFVSTCYHLCDSGDGRLDVYRECIVSYRGLFISDFIQSVTVPINIFTFNLPHGTEYIQDLSIAISLIVPVYLANIDDGKVNITAFYTFGFLLSFLIIGIRGFMRYLRHDSVWFQWPLRNPAKIIWWIPLEGNLLFAGSTLVCWCVALPMFSYQDKDSYILGHSIWHCAAAFGTLTAFMFFDSIVLSTEYELHVATRQVHDILNTLIYLMKREHKTSKELSQTLNPFIYLKQQLAMRNGHQVYQVNSWDQLKNETIPQKEQRLNDLFHLLPPERARELHEIEILTLPK